MEEQLSDKLVPVAATGTAKVTERNPDAIAASPATSIAGPLPKLYIRTYSSGPEGRKSVYITEAGDDHEGAKSPTIQYGRGRRSFEHEPSIHDGDPLSGFRLVIIMFVVSLGLVMATMDGSIVATALIAIARAFDNYIDIQWVAQAYLLTWMGFTVVFARVSDTIGRRSALLVAWTLLLVCGIGAGLAHNLYMLIAFRALQGIGSAGLYALTMIVMPEILPVKYIGITGGLIGITLGVSSLLGPVIGGSITEHSAGFPRWVFLLNIPIGGCAILLILLAWPRKARETAPMISLRSFDFPSAILLTAASVMLVFGMQEGGADTFAWNSPTIIGTLAASGIAWIALAAWSIHQARAKTPLLGVNPLLPAAIFKNRTAVLGGIVGAGLGGFSFFVAVIELPQRFQLVNLASPESAGLRLMPLLGGSAFGAFMVGALNKKHNRSNYTLIVAAAFVLLGTGLLSSLSDTTEEVAKQYGFQVLMGLGVGMSFSSATIIGFAEATLGTRAVTQGLIDQARLLGGSIGLAASTIIFNKKLTDSLSTILTPSELHSVHQSLSEVAFLAPAQQNAVRSVFAAAFAQDMRMCMYVSVVFLICALAAWKPRNEDLDAIKARDDAEAAALREKLAEGSSGVQSSGTGTSYGTRMQSSGSGTGKEAARELGTESEKV